MKEQCAGCPTRVLANASVNGMRYRTWSGFHTVMKQRPAPRKSSRHRRLGGSHRVRTRMQAVWTQARRPRVGKSAAAISPHILQRQARCLCWEPRRARRVATTVPEPRGDDLANRGAPAGEPWRWSAADLTAAIARAAFGDAPSGRGEKNADRLKRDRDIERNTEIHCAAMEYRWYPRISRHGR